MFGKELAELDQSRMLVYLGVAVAVVFLLYRCAAPRETNEVTGTIISVTERNLLVSIPGTTVAATYDGPARLRKGQEIVLEEMILGDCTKRVPFNRQAPLRRKIIKDCRKRYTVKDTGRTR